MEWMILPLKRYAEFSGRSRRKEYWMFFLLTLLVTIGLGIATGGEEGISGVVDEDGGMSFVMIVFYIAILIPTVAVEVRRFHDQDKSGWFVLLNFVPFVGWLIVLVLMCLEGTKGENQYGPDPKGAVDIDGVF